MQKQNSKTQTPTITRDGIKIFINLCHQHRTLLNEGRKLLGRKQWPVRVPVFIVNRWREKNLISVQERRHLLNGGNLLNG